jgi:hypothetical protein
VQFRKETDGGPCWAEKEGRLQPGDLLASANGQICLDERPFSDVVQLLQVQYSLHTVPYSLLSLAADDGPASEAVLP